MVTQKLTVAGATFQGGGVLSNVHTAASESGLGKGEQLPHGQT